MNPYQAPHAPLQGAESTRRPPVHRYQQGFAIGWFLVAAAIGCMVAYDTVVVIRVGGLASMYFILTVPMGAYAAASIHFGRMLWRSSTRARLVGTIVSSMGCLLMALLLFANLTNGLTQSRPAAILAAIVCVAGMAFCVVSLRVSRMLV